MAPLKGSISEDRRPIPCSKVIYQNSVFTHLSAFTKNQGLSVTSKWQDAARGVPSKILQTSYSSPLAETDVDALTEAINKNIATLIALYSREEKKVDRPQRAVELLTSFFARSFVIWGSLLFIFLWMFGNTVAPFLHLVSFDPPPFTWLQDGITIAGFALALMILSTQNRQSKIEERHAQLDLQVNLLAEQKIAKIIALLEELRRDLPNVKNRYDAEAESMQEAADPLAVLNALEETLESIEEAMEQQDSEDFNLTGASYTEREVGSRGD